MTATLTTLATISAALIVLALTAALVGLQMLSRYGSRAGRMVMAEPVGLLIGIAGILGVGLPVWATVESWIWLTVLGFSGFGWSLFAIGLASYLTLSRQNPRWLTVHTVSREFPLPSLITDTLSLRLGRIQSTLLEIAAGTDEADPSRHVTLRAIALVGLARYRLDGGKNADLLQLVDTLVERTRSPGAAKGPPEETASLLSVLALASNDSDVALSVVTAVRELVQDAIQQHQPVRRSLLDEAAGLVTDRLHVLLDSASIDWLAGQEPIEQHTGIPFAIPDGQVMGLETGYRHDEMVVPDHVDRDVIREWLDTSGAPERSEWKVLSALVPAYDEHREDAPEETIALITVSTLVEPECAQEVPESGDRATGPSSDEVPEDDHLRHDAAANKADEEPTGRRTIIRDSRRRHSDAYDLLEEGVDLLVSACAAPAPDDTTWPGGWRGVSALQEDIQRLAAISVSLYKAGRHTPTDRVERAIETIAERVVRAHRSVRNPDDLSNVTGWRLGERALEHTTAHSATEALRELGIEAWRAGFGRRALFTIRRLLSIIVVAPKEDTELLDELEEDLQLSVIRTARSTDDSLADRERSRQLVLSLAPEFMALGQSAQPHADDVLWEQVFGTLDTIAWSPAGSEIEAATEIYLYFLSGTDPSASLEAGRPWDVVSWNRRPVCQPQELPPRLREHLLQALCSDATSDQPGIALLIVVALWRDVLVRDDRQALEAFRDALAEHVLDGGRRDFELPILWSHTDNTAETVPRFRGPGICHPPPSWDHPSATSMGPPRPRSCRPTLMLPGRILDVKQPACAAEERAVAIGRRAGASEALLPLRDDRARAS